MRKLITFNMMSLDGFFEGPGGELDWHHVDGEFNEFALEQIGTADTLLFGRKTYELMAGYWPTPEAATDDPAVASIMNSYPKIVFSETLDKADWNNTRLVKEPVAEAVTRLKQQPGKDMLLLGSAFLSSTLMQHRLIDEFRVMINPVVLGKGNPLFLPAQDKLELQLLKVKVFNSGNVLLFYQPVRK
ncbi:dihydrofolate reductase family protein [Compostibacter hankyongensis]|uniref:Dihydrofolate reductase family protein n=1 Tax=Compostibacter hankyongensis TaxID=1007089 RepID=A0ABP8FFU9_9BACT